MVSPTAHHLSGWIALFPGQGSQFVGMGRELCDEFSIARLAFEEASEAISVNLKKLCFDGPDSDLVLTANTQPALLTTSVAAFRVAEAELGFKPALAAGHSLGEYSALVAVGAVELATAVSWVRSRGTFMQQAVPPGQGTMAAILSMDDGVVESLCRRATELARLERAEGMAEDFDVEAFVEPANYNAPGQVVIAGSSDAVALAVALVKAGVEFGRGKAMPLSVSAPFHCRLMKPARDKMAEIFAQANAAQKPKIPHCPYIPNRTGRPNREAGIILDFLIEQVDHPVLWKQSVQSMLAAGFVRGVEFGPGKILQGLAKRIEGSDGKTLQISTLGDLATLKELGSTYDQ